MQPFRMRTQPRGARDVLVTLWVKHVGVPVGRIAGFAAGRCARTSLAVSDWLMLQALDALYASGSPQKHICEV